jgi:hypothetical protein
MQESCQLKLLQKQAWMKKPVMQLTSLYQPSAKRVSTTQWSQTVTSHIINHNKQVLSVLKDLAHRQTQGTC